MADAIFNRVDWNLMSRGTNVVRWAGNPPPASRLGNWIG